MNWEASYAAGSRVQRYPWDVVVSFVYRYGRPADRILEVGCGTGANLWFAAREGFEVFGVDISAAAIRYARDRFAGEGLGGDFSVGDFSTLAHPDSFFDLVVDRAALSYTDDIERPLSEIRRVLKPSGRFLFTPFSTRSPEVEGGPRYYSEGDLRSALRKWEIDRCSHVEATGAHAYWLVVAH